MDKAKKKKWVSDIIAERYKLWKDEYVILDCGTGSGKTYFCLNILGRYASKQSKKILYLCNRSELREQVYAEVKKLELLDVIKVQSYQRLQKDIQEKKEIKAYDYIIADECHYFTSDATFNEYTDIAYNYVMGQKQAVVLLVSATAKLFFKQLLDKRKVKKKNVFRFDKDYSYVDKLYYYQSDELITIIKDILENEVDSKIVVFCNVGQRIKEMYNIFREDANYYCSKSTSDTKLKKICGWSDGKKNNCIKRYSETLITFEKRILFTMF